MEPSGEEFGPAHPLLGRDRELELIEDAVDRASKSAGSVLLVEGPPGIGKTRLLQHGAAKASEAGFVVLESRGSDLESEFTFGVIRQLLERHVSRQSPERRAEVFAGAAATAASVLGNQVPTPGPGPGDLHPLLHGLYWLCSNLAESEPLLLVFDDAHWADEPSLRFLHYLSSRVDGLPILALAAARTTAPEAPVPLIEETRAQPTVRTAMLPPLDAEDCRMLLACIFKSEPDPGFVGVCRHASGGNPFLLSELASSLVAEGAEPLDKFANRAETTSPAAVSHGVFRRMSRMSPDARSLAVAVAILGEHVDLAIAAELAGLTVADALSSADDLRAGGIFAAQDSWGFLHPMMHETVYGDIASGKRSTLHERAADLILKAGGDHERAAAHLHEIEPRQHPRHAACLRSAAQMALARGVPAVAARHLQRALLDETSRESRIATLVELGMAETLARAPTAPERFREALRLTDLPGDRAEIVRALAHSLALAARIDDAITVITSELADTEAHSRSTRLRLEADLCGTLLFARHEQLEELDARLERLREGVSGDSPAERDLRAAMAYRLVQRGGDVARARALAEQVAAEMSVEDTMLGGVTISCLLITLLETESLSTLRRVAEEGQRRGRALGAPFPVGLNLDLLAVVDYRQGNLARAEALIYEAVDLCRKHGIHVGLPIALTAMVDVLVALGKPEEAWRQLAHDGFAGSMPDLYGFGYLMEARGRLQLLSGQPEKALADAVDAGDRMRRWGSTGAAGTRWRSDAALAHVRLGNRSSAVALADEDVRLARQHGAVWPLGNALRTQGLVHGGDAGIAVLRESESILVSSEYPLELARTRLELGAALRRRGSRREAREPLRAALDACARIGATPDAERAQDELAATGARPRNLAASGIQALTPSEYRVAQLAAENMTNREIAQSLFVTMKTVETHLGHVYSKLGIAGRGELSSVMNG